ncbi:MAG: dinitrogenase iron-molybdenum cofactor biosynthesis protein [Actinobacteria bacterium]|nr:dinitrogenase iron-molybdenum cofactor biosynthesis protein [Actinomycetota bacterium]
MTDSSTIRKVAVPSEAPGGLEAIRSGHFGHCAYFTIITVEDGVAGAVEVVPNVPHVEGGCMQPVLFLANHGVSDIVVSGMGARPLAGFQQVGITVHYDIERALVGEVVQAFLAGSLQPMLPTMVCGGH